MVELRTVRQEDPEPEGESYLVSPKLENAVGLVIFIGALTVVKFGPDYKSRLPVSRSHLSVVEDKPNWKQLAGDAKRLVVGSFNRLKN